MIKKIKEIRRKILYYYKLGNKFKKIHKSNKTAFVCVESPVHNNMGDQALGFARSEYIQKIGINKKQIIDISTPDRMNYCDYIKNSVKDSDVILLRGGGFFGTLWEDGFIVILDFIKMYPNNKIILFPQSVHFDNTIRGKELLELSKKIIGDRKNLYLFARDFSSFELFKKFYSNVKVYVTPDTVFSYKPTFKNNAKNNEILICLRNDKEKKLDDFQIKKLYNIIQAKNLTVKKQDTCINYHFKDIEEREEKLYELWKTFHESQLVITDRLHGMIFSVITETPCIVFDNVDSKISNAYKWIDNLKYVKFLNDIDDLESTINKMLLLKDNYYPIDEMLEKFEPLKKVLLEIE